MLDWYEVLLAQKLNGGGSGPGPGPGPGPEPTPTDGNTHIYMEIAEGTPAANMIFYVYFQASVLGGVTIDWGDGVTELSNKTTAYSYPHTYATPGKYEIVLTVREGSITFAGAAQSVAIFGNVNPDNMFNRDRVQRVVFGSNANVGSCAFYECRSLKSVVLPSNITTINERIFYNCLSLESIIIPDNVTSIEKYAFGNCLSLKSIIIPDNVTSIGESAFAACRNLQYVKFPRNMTSIGSQAFSSCELLKNVDVPDGITSIEGSSFSGCLSLQSVNLPNSLTTIKGGAFDNCLFLESVIIPSGVTSIETAFSKSYGISELRLMPTTPPTISSSCLSFLRSNGIIYVPAESLEAYKTASNWSAYANKIQAMPE